ncbi:uncharacterized protein LOC129776364 [Toxorhynchites rutilus septentrionalis]|uniref:uncharacterized protein LOC129776364 n=1 Tax=Toxorhynchites rutilus septentrionalis TaxID=329112 RepID=UPI002478E9CB|nr:uncharacterized protein LOC129776364 [Toxorhynchites rutilus septentrionalis]
MKLFVVSFLVVLNFGKNNARLAPILSACSRNDPNFEQCVKQVVERIRPNVAVGNFGEDQPSAPPLEPLWVKQMAIDHGPGFRVKLTNVTIEGSGAFEIRRVKLNVDEKQFNVSVKLPRMLVSGQYALDMQMPLLRISGQGDFNLILNNTIANMRMRYYLEQEKETGGESVQFQPIQLKLKFDKGKFNLKNLFDGDAVLGQIANDAINQDPHVLLDEVKPAFEQSLGNIFTEIANSAVRGASELDILPL